MIDYLPDHMHEGLCEVPANLGQSLTFAGYTTQEYRSLGGHQERPEVIAWATSRNTDGHEYGVLGAYDGHRVGVGRVAVDATWHHWFNINLTGLLAASDPMNPATYDPVAAAKWNEIQAYYRNVALWLARPSTQTCLRNGGWVFVLQYYDIRIAWKDLKLVREPALYFYQLGVYARDALGRLASQCQTTRWIVDLWPEIELHIDPWVQVPRPQPDPPPWVNLYDLENVALGSAIHHLFEQFGTAEPQEVLKGRAKDVEAVARKGAAIGLQHAFTELRQGWARFDAVAKGLKEKA